MGLRMEEKNHRYVLRRSWGFNTSSGRIVNFIMLNPSTAGDVFDDPTIRRCVGFSKRWGFDGIVVTNLFSFRATNPEDLRKIAESNARLAIGESNDEWIVKEAANSSAVICAWGNKCDDIILGRDLYVVSMLRSTDLFCIRRTKKGNPAHPVREGYTKEPTLFMPKLADQHGRR